MPTAAEEIKAELKQRTPQQKQPPLPIDWDEVRACYVKGLSLQDLSDKYGIPYGTLRSRSSREKWCNTVAAARKAVNQGATAALVESATGWISKIDSTMHAALDNIIQKGVQKLGLRDLQIALDCADKANRIARQTYGLDNAAATNRPTMVQVNVHNAPGPGTSPVATAKAAIVTDIVDVPAESSTDSLPPST